MNVNFIIPAMPELRQPRAYIPLGVAYIAAVLEQDGHEVSITDLNATDRYQDADVYGITVGSAVVNQIPGIIWKLREFNPAAVVVIGGVHPSIDPCCFNLPSEKMTPNYVIAGEGEYAFRYLLRNHPGSPYSIIINAGYIDNLDELPFPARHLFDNVVNYTGIHGQEPGEGATSILSSRGCPYRCAYCTKIPQTTHLRFTSPEYMVNEMDHVMAEFPDVTHFRWVDDLFTFDQKRITKFCNLKCERGNDATWLCITRADRITDDELLDSMKQAGCTEIHIGVESGSQQVLDMMHKRTTVDQNRKAIQKIKEHGIRAKAYLMYGFPGETDHDRDRTVQFMKETKPDKFTLSHFTPLPGSDIYPMVLDEGGYTHWDWFYPDINGNKEYEEFRDRISRVLRI